MKVQAQWRAGNRYQMAKSAAIEPFREDRLAAVKAWPQRARSFYNDVRTEMKKVTTPSRKEVQGTTTVVIITVFLFGLVGGPDPSAALVAAASTASAPAAGCGSTSLVSVLICSSAIRSAL